MHLSITLTIISLISLSLAAPVPARVVATSDKHQVSWGLLANGPSFTGIPVLLGAATDDAGSIYLSNTTVLTAGQTRLRFELKKQEGNFIGANIMDYENEDVNLNMFQAADAKKLVYGPVAPVGAKAGSWGFKKMDGNWILALDEDYNAKAVWREDVEAYQVHFGSDIPAEEGGINILLEGFFL